MIDGLSIMKNYILLIFLPGSAGVWFSYAFIVLSTSTGDSVEKIKCLFVMPALERSLSLSAI